MVKQQNCNKTLQQYIPIVLKQQTVPMGQRCFHSDVLPADQNGSDIYTTNCS